jgi:hypothetical protein
MAELGAPRDMTEREEKLVLDTLREWDQMKNWRYTFATQWEETAELIWPEQRNTFQYGDFNWPGQKKTDRQIDSTGMLALNTFAAVVDSLVTPVNQCYQELVANDEYVMKDRPTRLWFDRVTKLLFKYRYSPYANFTGQNYISLKSLGAFGNRGVLIEEFDGTQFGNVRELRYRNIPLGELYIRENHQQQIDGFVRAFRLTAYQIYQRFKDSGRIPESVVTALEQKAQTPYYVLHRVWPASDYDPEALDRRRMPWHSVFVFSGQGVGGTNFAVGQSFLLEEGGYYSFPMAISRYEQAPMEVYGRGPATFVLPTLKTLNAMKRTFLKQAHRAADPVLLTTDDGLLDFDLSPGALNKGGMSADGKPLVGILPSGAIQVSKEMMAGEIDIIKTAFLVNIFQILTETPTMTATEVIERVNEKGMLLAPTVGRQQSEHLGPMTHRELDLLMRMRVLPPMPPRLREAGGEYDVVYTSPMAKASRAGAAAGFMRTLESVKEVVSITGDPSPLDAFAFDRATPAIADIQGVPEDWMASPEEVQAKRTNRAKAAQQQAQVQAAPAQAALISANAKMIAAKGGAQQPGVPGSVAPAEQPPVPGGP